MSEESKSNQVNPPPNDRFANPRMLSQATGIVQGSNVGAIAEPNEPWHRGRQARKSVWFRWQALPFDSFAIFLFAKSNFNSRLAAYSEIRPGNDFSILAPTEPFVCLSDFKPGVVAFRARANRAYRIAVDGLDDNSGPSRQDAVRDSGASLQAAAGDSGEFSLQWAAAENPEALATKIENLIDGTVTDINSVPRQGVWVNLAILGTPTGNLPDDTEADGSYQFINMASSRLPFIARPSLSGHYFVPEQRDYSSPTVSFFEDYKIHPLPTLNFLGKLRDCVNPRTTASDGLVDGTFRLTFPAGSGGGEVIELTLTRQGGKQWKTELGVVPDVLGVAYALNDPLLNNSAGRVQFLVPDGTTIHLFAADDSTNTLFLPGSQFELTIKFSDGRTPKVSLTI